MPIPRINLTDYNYELPPEKIALRPLENRDESQLLFYNAGDIQIKTFKQLPELLPSNALLVLNNTKVLPARFLFPTSSKRPIEVFCLEPANCDFQTALLSQGPVVWKVLIGNAKKWKKGETLKLKNENLELTVTYEAQKEGNFFVKLAWRPETTLYEIFQRLGNVPLPPYIKRQADAIDAERYQTVYASALGSVAAPTAGLHFTQNVLSALKQRGICIDTIILHVGAGTFLPITASDLQNHVMHSEYFWVEKSTIENLLYSSKPIIAVGTTVMRTLESLYQIGKQLETNELEPSAVTVSQWQAYQTNKEISQEAAFTNLLKWIEKNQTNGIGGQTHLLIAPGYHFGICKGLITNFHQPQSTLLLLVAAFIGDAWKLVYECALANHFRFLSYGDASLLIPYQLL
jgi:S-adenosylmethionine:tRNA ribosyltransferase-isomerase